MLFRSFVFCFLFPSHDRPAYTEEQQVTITNAIAKLYLEGFSNRAMAIWITENKNIPITHTSVSKYLGKVMDDWRKERISKIDDLLIIELQGLNRVEREAWDGWYRSLKDKTKNVSKRKGSPQKRIETGGDGKERRVKFSRRGGVDFYRDWETDRKSVV